MTVQRKRVVITGMGVLCSIASDTQEFREALYAKTCGIKPSEKYEKYFKDANASEVLQEIPYEGLEPEAFEYLDNAALWAYKVGYEALQQGKLTDPAELEKTGLIIGVSSAGTEAYIPMIEAHYEKFSVGKSIISGSFSSCSAIVAALLKLKGGFEMIATACTASPNAIGMAFDYIQNGKQKTSLVIGTEPLYLPTFAGFYNLKAMKRTPSSPFSGEPGMSIGEGAGSVLLEEYEHAIARGATIYGEILSYATSGDAYHETAPDPLAAGAVQVMNKALENAGVTTADIQYINAHGTGTEANDRCETLAMKKVFPNIADIPVSSTKSYIGHNIGSAGIIELIACLLTLKDGKILPTLNFTTPRPNCDLNYVPNEFQEGNVDLFMKSNYAFGGNNCCIIASSHTERKHPISTYQPKRVAITGIGLISSLGHTYDTIMSRVWAGEEATTEDFLFQSEEDKKKYLAQFDKIIVPDNIKEIITNEYGEREELEASLDSRYLFHKVNDLEPRKFLRHYDPRKANAISTFALIAITQAMKNANRKIKRDGQDLGIILGMSKGPQSSVQRFLSSILPDPNKVRTSEFPTSLMNAIATYCSISESIKGYNTTLATGYNAGMGAVIYGYEIVRQSLQPQVLTGGSDELPPKEAVNLMANTRETQLSTDKTSFRVYENEGKGSFMGEGSAILFLEDYQHAQNRNVPILAEIIGWGKMNDTCYLKQIIDFNENDRVTAIVRAIQQAIAEANISIKDIDLVCGSSYGTVITNRVELEAIHQAFAEEHPKVPVVNYIAHYGFVESCAGIFNIATVIECMKRGEILPIPYTESYLRDDIAFVRQPIKKQINIALILASTEGGNHYATIIKRGDA